PTASYSAYLDVQKTRVGFDVAVYLRNVHLAGKFSAFQFDTDFPSGIIFLGITPGEIIQNFGVGYNAVKGHSKEGRVGGYASSLDAVDGMEDQVADDELFVTLHFEGPLGAYFGVSLHNWKLTLGANVLPATLPDNIKHQ
ncbi:hypothetical protein LCGC14_2562520, partial [marine sediment metagenome]